MTPRNIPPGNRRIDNWRDAEMNAADWMRYWGYLDAKAAPGGSDGGVDIRSRHALAQVKFQGAAVGRPALQRLVGARMNSEQQLLFFTGSNYARPALEYADAMAIALFIYDPWGRMKPVGDAARRIIDGGEQGELADAAARLMSWLNATHSASTAAARQPAGAQAWADRIGPLAEKVAKAVADLAAKPRHRKAPTPFSGAPASRVPRLDDPDHLYDGSLPLKNGRDDLRAGLMLGAIPLLWLLNLDPVGWVEALFTGLCWLGLGYGVYQWRVAPDRPGGVRHPHSIAKRRDWERRQQAR